MGLYPLLVTVIVTVDEFTPFEGVPPLEIAQVFWSILKPVGRLLAEQTIPSGL